MAEDGQHDPYQAQRAAMVATQLRARDITDARVLAAFERVPRHEFVPPEQHDDAYADFPLPIGGGQTISQPYIVALMLQAAEVRPGDIGLEIGTGSGYQAALMAELAVRVYSIERVAPLAARAEAVLRRLGYANVEVVVGDGSEGLPQHAPFNVIIVSAAAPSVPPPLFQQLAEGGRLVVPVGSPFSQELQLVRKIAGEPVISRREGCRFVPLIGAHAFREER